MSESKDQVLGFIAEETRLGRLATVSGDGAPHVVPIWFKLDGDRILIHTQAESRKAQNISATGKYALTVDKDTMPYKGATVKGRGEVVGNDVVDSLALVRELAVTYVGPEGGPGYGDYIASMPGEHVTLVLNVDDVEYWDYS
jgi:PPOX class probable F420-dependent enzyme